MRCTAHHAPRTAHRRTAHRALRTAAPPHAPRHASSKGGRQPPHRRGRLGRETCAAEAAALERSAAQQREALQRVLAGSAAEEQLAPRCNRAHPTHAAHPTPPLTRRRSREAGIAAQKASAQADKVRERKLQDEKLQEQRMEQRKRRLTKEGVLPSGS